MKYLIPDRARTVREKLDSKNARVLPRFSPSLPFFKTNDQRKVLRKEFFAANFEANLLAQAENEIDLAVPAFLTRLEDADTQQAAAIIDGFFAPSFPDLNKKNQKLITDKILACLTTEKKTRKIFYLFIKLFCCFETSLQKQICDALLVLLSNKDENIKLMALTSFPDILSDLNPDLKSTLINGGLGEKLLEIIQSNSLHNYRLKHVAHELFVANVHHFSLSLKRKAFVTLLNITNKYPLDNETLQSWQALIFVFDDYHFLGNILPSLLQQTHCLDKNKRIASYKILAALFFKVQPLQQQIIFDRFLVRIEEITRECHESVLEKIIPCLNDIQISNLCARLANSFDDEVDKGILTCVIIALIPKLNQPADQFRILELLIKLCEKMEWLQDDKRLLAISMLMLKLKGPAQNKGFNLFIRLFKYNAIDKFNDYENVRWFLRLIPTLSETQKKEFFVVTLELLKELKTNNAYFGTKFFLNVILKTILLEFKSLIYDLLEVLTELEHYSEMRSSCRDEINVISENSIKELIAQMLTELKPETLREPQRSKVIAIILRCYKGNGLAIFRNVICNPESNFLKILTIEEKKEFWNNLLSTELSAKEMKWITESSPEISPEVLQVVFNVTKDNMKEALPYFFKFAIKFWYMTPIIVQIFAYLASKLDDAEKTYAFKELLAKIKSDEPTTTEHYETKQPTENKVTQEKQAVFALLIYCIPHLKEAEKDQAFAALWQILNPKNFIENPKKPVVERENIIKLLGYLMGQLKGESRSKIWKMLISLTEHPITEFRIAACSTINKYLPQFSKPEKVEALECLVARFDDSDAMVRSAAKSSLRSFLDIKSIKIIKIFMNQLAAAGINGKANILNNLVPVINSIKKAKTNKFRIEQNEKPLRLGY